MAVEARKRLFTVDEFHRMGEAGVFDDDTRLELVGGEIFEMPPIGPPHAGSVGFLADFLTRHLGERALVYTQNPFVLDRYSELLPDIVVLERSPDFYRTRHPEPRDSLVLVEVADSSVRRDRTGKLPRYARAGVPEVWLVDLPARRIEVYREPTGGAYSVTLVLGPDESLSPAAFPDVVLQVARILG